MKKGKRSLKIAALALAIAAIMAIQFITWLKQREEGQETMKRNNRQVEKWDEEQKAASDLRSLCNVLKAEIVDKNFQRALDKPAQAERWAAEDYDRLVMIVTSLLFFAPAPITLTSVPPEAWKKINLSAEDGDQMIFHATRNIVISFVTYGDRFRKSGGIKGEEVPARGFIDTADMMDFALIILDEMEFRPEEMIYSNNKGKKVKITGALIRRIASANLAERIDKIRQEIDDRYEGEQLKAHIALLKVSEKLAKEPVNKDQAGPALRELIRRAQARQELARLCQKVNFWPEKQRAAFEKIRALVEKSDDPLIHKVFRRVKANHEARKNALTPLLELGRRGIDEWHFGPKILGLKDEEIKLLKKPADYNLPAGSKKQMPV